MLNWPPKDPGATFDYRWDTPLDAGDSVSTADIQLLSGEVTILQQESDATGVTIWLSGGTPGGCLFYAIATTTSGRKPDEYIGLQITEAPPVGATLPLPVPGVAAPDYASFSALYPALADKVRATGYNALFAQAALYIDNTNWSLISDIAARTALMNIVVAHLASLPGGPGSSGTAPTLIGRLTEVSEGSVRAKAELNADGIPAFWAQTAYGISYWQATAPYRTMQYFAPPEMPLDPYPFAALGQGFGGAWPWQ